MNPKAVLVLGDEQYPAGSGEGFAESFDPTWGRLKAVLRPSVGNHEYGTPQAKGYFDYFGAAAGKRGEGWYSFDLGGWHLISLNSNCDRVGCGPDSPQLKWLRADLASHPNTCTLAYFHHPRFSSGPHGGDRKIGPIWDALYSAGADLVLNGHDHHYERFGPQRPDATPDSARGLREFIAGTGGKSHYPTVQPAQNSEVRRTGVYGVLKLSLYPSRYEWEFISTDGSFHDSGQAVCH
jgi:alkaline phosphatase